MTIHLLALVALWAWFPDPFCAGVETPTLMGGGLAYAFVFSLAATSSDFAFGRLGVGRWRRLHTIGSYFIWCFFALIYVAGVSESIAFVPYAAALVIALGLRIAGRVRGRAHG
jgi:DMSO/TMAO reductase YedYZ heme-binding membrane subunit